MAKYRLVPAWLTRLLMTPVAELGRWQFAARFLAELCLHGWRKLREDRAGQMAAALSFRTIFGIIPLTAIGMVLFRAFGGLSAFQNLVNQLLEGIGLDKVVLPDSNTTLANQVGAVINDVGSNLTFSTIGIVGVLLLAWAAVGLLTTIERSFNTVCRAPEHRPLHRRLPMYWMTITVGPALLAVSFYLNNQFDNLLTEFPWGGATVVWLSGMAVSFGSTWLLLLGLYVLMPNTRVSLRSATWGAFLAAILWRIGANLFGAYLSLAFTESTRLAVLYGSLGLIPVFLLWVYSMWLVILFGLEITHSLQAVGGKLGQAIPERGPQPKVVEPTFVLPVMHVVAERFRQGQRTRASDVAEALGLSYMTSRLFLDALAEDGLLHRMPQGDEVQDLASDIAFVLARPPETIDSADILATAHRIVGRPDDRGSSAWSLVRRMRQSQLDLARTTTLAQLSSQQ